MASGLGIMKGMNDDVHIRIAVRQQAMFRRIGGIVWVFLTVSVLSLAVTILNGGTSWWYYGAIVELTLFCSVAQMVIRVGLNAAKATEQRQREWRDKQLGQ